MIIDCIAEKILCNVMFGKLSIIHIDFAATDIHVSYRENPSERDSRSNDVSGLHVLICDSHKFVHNYCRHGERYE